MGAPSQPVTDDGISYLELGPEANSVLAGIGFSLFYVDEETDQMLLLGTDNEDVYKRQEQRRTPYSPTGPHCFFRHRPPGGTALSGI